ncbi:WxcM-like domain-containing protein [Candidatus Woesearchaeota archaeon]|nr:WxcM-like domain-containing protein [Candidatus Woesearchaeota archaeon]
MDIKLTRLDKKVDERGFVVEVLRSEMVKAPFGQIFLSTVKPGKVKGNHYHKRKREWYCVVRGNVAVSFVDVATGEKKKVLLDEKTPQLLEINPGISHAITNEGEEEAMILAYISESFNPDDPDTFEFKVI